MELRLLANLAQDVREDNRTVENPCLPQGFQMNKTVADIWSHPCAITQPPSSMSLLSLSLFVCVCASVYSMECYSCDLTFCCVVTCRVTVSCSDVMLCVDTVSCSDVLLCGDTVVCVVSVHLLNTVDLTEGDLVFFNGTSDSARCAMEVDKLFPKVSCDFGTCGINGTFQPLVNGTYYVSVVRLTLPTPILVCVSLCCVNSLALPSQTYSPQVLLFPSPSLPLAVGHGAIQSHIKQAARATILQCR